MVALLTLAGCGDRASGAAVVVRDSAGATIVDSRAPEWAAGEGWTVASEPSLSIGTLDGPPESQLFRVRGATRLPDGSVVINNAGTVDVRVYGPGGRHVRSLGGQGRGPGEFGWIDWVQFFPPDTLLVKDGSVNRATWFTLDGTHVATRSLTSPVGPYGFPRRVLPDGRLLEYQSQGNPPDAMAGHTRWTIAAVAYAMGDSVLDTLVVAPGSEGFLIQVEQNGRTAVVNMGVPFGSESYRAVQGGTIAMGDGGAYDLRVRRHDGARLRIRRPVERRPVTDVDVRRWIDERVDRYPESRRAQARVRFEAAPTSPLMPTYSGLQVDRTGNVWVEAYRAPGNNAPRTWSVFDPDGRWLGDVAMPEGLEVYEIGEGLRARQANR